MEQIKIERRYERCKKQLNESLNNIENPIAKNILTMFCEDYINNMSIKTFINDEIKIVRCIQKLKIFDFENFSDKDMFKLFIEDFMYYKIFKYIYMNNLILKFNKNKNKYRFFYLTCDPIFFKMLYDDVISMENVIYFQINNRTTQKIIYRKQILNIKNNKVTQLLQKFYDQKISSSFDHNFLNEFADYLDSMENLCLNESHLESFLLNNLNKKNSFLYQTKEFFIWYICQIEVKERNKRFKHYTLNVLKKHSFITHIKNGYRPVLYSKFDKVPKVDNMLIIPNGEERKSTQFTEDSVLPVSFSMIINKPFKNSLKEYFWNSELELKTRIHNIQTISNFLNMYFKDEDKIYSFEPNVFARYKSYIINNYSKTETRNGRIYPIIGFLRYIEQNNLFEVNKNVYIYLDNKGSLNFNGAKGVKQEDLKIIANYLNKIKDNSYKDMMMYTVFHICINTEFRISQILTLTIDCVKPSMKKNEYVIESITKVSGGQIIKQTCPLIVKRIIADFISYSSTLREKCTDENIKKYIFIEQNQYNSLYKILSLQSFNKYLKNICIELGIEKYTAKNLRATYITNAKEYALKNGLSDATLLGITGHRNVNTINNHYLQEKIRDAIQATNNIIIGNVDIKGNIIKDKSTIHSEKEVMVENECGYCQNDYCDLHGPLSCLLCKHFATTVDRIPFFEQQLKYLDQQISHAKFRHDIEDLVNLKRLFAAYLEKLLFLKEVDKNG